MLSQMNVLIKLQSNTSDPEHSPNYTGILEPDLQHMPSLLVAQTLTSVKRGVACSRVMNPTTEDCHVPGDRFLGEFHSVVNQSGEEFSLVEATVANLHAQPVTFPKVDFSQTALDGEQKQELESLILKYADIFSTHDRDFGRTDKVQHSIRTGDAEPIKQ